VGAAPTQSRAGSRFILVFTSERGGLGVRRHEIAGAKPRREKRRTGKVRRLYFYLPFVSTFAFSSSFIFFTIGSRLASPVVWVVVAGGALLGMELCSVGFLAGRVAVVGGGFACALATCAFKRRAPANSGNASAVELGFIDLISSQTEENDPFDPTFPLRL
jgi:hypothetical protein